MALVPQIDHWEGWRSKIKSKLMQTKNATCFAHLLTPPIFTHSKPGSKTALNEQAQCFCHCTQDVKTWLHLIHEICSTNATSISGSWPLGCCIRLKPTHLWKQLYQQEGSPMCILVLLLRTSKSSLPWKQVTGQTYATCIQLGCKRTWESEFWVGRWELLHVNYLKDVGQPWIWHVCCKPIQKT